MKLTKLIAAGGTTALAVGVLVALAPAATAATPPYEPDPQSFGTLTFYNASGTQITSGNINTAPMAAYVVGQHAGRVGDHSTLLNMAQPNPNALTGNWNVDNLTGQSDYPLSSSGNPANIVTMSQTLPVSKGTSGDFSVADFIAEFPNDPAHDSNASYQNLYQVRLVTTNGADQDPSYQVADIMVSGSTWTEVYPTGGTPPADSTSISISAPGSVKYNTGAKLGTVLKDTTTNAAISGASVTLKERASSSKPWSTVGSVTTSSTGAASKTVTLKANEQFEWTYAGNSSHKSATSSVKSVSATQVVSINAPTSARHGTTFKIWGTVSPTSSGQSVTLQHKVGTKWVNQATATIKSQRMPNGKTITGYVFGIKETRTGNYTFRVEKGKTATLATGDSPSKTVKVT
jgi:hypothetical protein